MTDLEDGQTFEMQGSGAKPYVLKNTGGVYSCSCPAWRNQSVAIERRTCKHLRRLRGDAAEEARLGGELPARPVRPKTSSAGGEEGGGSDGPPLLLAESWDVAFDPAGWWMSEKLDGVRAYWDGSRFISRLGNEFLAPEWFVEGLPSSPLDGELWLGRKNFQRAVSIVRRRDKTELWRDVRYVVFDAPAAGGGFEERLAFIHDALASGRPAFAEAHVQALCGGFGELRAELARVEGLGGEGLMLRKPGSKYESGRSSTLLKVKNFHDAEAVVTGHQAGAGKHKGRLGALLARFPSGVEFAVGTGFSDRERAAPPPPGSVIVVRYQELTESGAPRFPSYGGLRAEGAAPSPATQAPAGPPPAPAMPKPASKTSVVVPAPPPVPPAAAAPPGSERRFEFVEGKSSKFWAVSRSGCEVTTRWGRIGSAGQSKTKPYPTEEAAARQEAKLIEEKTGEGYIETT